MKGDDWLDRFEREVFPTASEPGGDVTTLAPVSESDAAVGAIPWPDPVLLAPDLSPVPAFDLALMPPAFRPWVEDVADRMQVPAEFVAVPQLVAYASVVARRWAILPKASDDWLVVPNLWGALIGRPGVLKTPSLEEASRPLRDLESESAAAHEEAVRVWEATCEVGKLLRKNREATLKARLKGGADPEVLAWELAAAGEQEKPARRRYLVYDATPEALAVVLRDNPGGVLAYRDELIGMLKGLEKQGREDARAMFLEGWNGGQRFESNRIGRGDVRLPDLTLSLLGGIQPGPLRDYFREASAGQTADGFVQRLQLAVWPDVDATWENIDRPPNLRARDATFRVFRHADMTDPEVLGARREPPDAIRAVVRFHPDAQVEFNQWREIFERRLRTSEEPPAMESHLSKYRSLVPTLALLWHVAEGRSGPVELDALLAGLAWLEYLEPHARRIYAPVLGPDVQGARVLVTRIRHRLLLDGFTARDVRKKHWASLKDQSQVSGALDLLEECGYLRAERTEDGRSGRPTWRYYINPKLG